MMALSLDTEQDDTKLGLSTKANGRMMYSEKYPDIQWYISESKIEYWSHQSPVFKVLFSGSFQEAVTPLQSIGMNCPELNSRKSWLDFFNLLEHESFLTVTPSVEIDRAIIYYDLPLVTPWASEWHNMKSLDSISTDQIVPLIEYMLDLNPTMIAWMKMKSIESHWQKICERSDLGLNKFDYIQCMKSAFFRAQKSNTREIWHSLWSITSNSLDRFSLTEMILPLAVSQMLSLVYPIFVSDGKWYSPVPIALSGFMVQVAWCLAYRSENKNGPPNMTDFDFVNPLSIRPDQFSEVVVDSILDRETLISHIRTKYNRTLVVHHYLDHSISVFPVGHPRAYRVWLKENSSDPPRIKIPLTRTGLDTHCWIKPNLWCTDPSLLFADTYLKCHSLQWWMPTLDVPDDRAKVLLTMIYQFRDVTWYD